MAIVNGLSVCAITKKLNNKNALNRNWRTTTINRMLSNYIYCGDYRKYDNEQEQIVIVRITSSLYEDVQDKQKIQSYIDKIDKVNEEYRSIKELSSSLNS